MSTLATDAKPSLDARKQAGLLAALAWIGRTTPLLASGPYSVSAAVTWDPEVEGIIGEVSVQGKPESTLTLRTHTAAMPDLEADERHDGYHHWTALVGDVRIRVVEEKA